MILFCFDPPHSTLCTPSPSTTVPSFPSIHNDNIRGPGKHFIPTGRYESPASCKLAPPDEPTRRGSLPLYRFPNHLQPTNCHGSRPRIGTLEQNRPTRESPVLASSNHVQDVCSRRFRGLVPGQARGRDARVRVLHLDSHRLPHRNVDHDCRDSKVLGM